MGYKNARVFDSSGAETGRFSYSNKKEAVSQKFSLDRKDLRKMGFSFLKNDKQKCRKRKSPRRGIEPRSPAFWLLMTGGDTDHYTIEDMKILTI